MPKTVAEKLLLKPGSAVWSSDKAALSIAGELPEGVEISKRAGDAAVALVVAPDAKTLTSVLKKHGVQLPRVATTWVLYPKGNATDINRDTIWPLLTEYGLRPNGQVSVDETWSALRFRALKDGEAPFAPGQS
jgi:hypothetical protein